MDKSSITFIGGADGPTKIFLAGDLLPAFCVGIAVILTAIFTIIWIKKNRK